eukprot:TRINITY_DN17370_c0_g1_i1.p1 TRINITY_DN17370_c0_g1~~TRINITY_DN17370_c0_g1_i1.p1  ORF type:complete len:535 (+),score=112.11 TRINITY_DN17370_c0_g1_i1:55-1659(+)
MDPNKVGAVPLRTNTMDAGASAIHPLQKQTAVANPLDAALTPLGSSKGSSREEISEKPLASISVLSSKLGYSQVPRTMEGLRMLAKSGAWSGFLQLSEVLSAETKHPQERIQFQCCRLIALFRLRRYAYCEQHINDLGDLNDAKYRFESHPEYFENKTGSMIPFTLHLLHAEIPHRIGNTLLSLDRLYQLLSLCEREKGRIEKDIADAITCSVDGVKSVEASNHEEQEKKASPSLQAEPDTTQIPVDVTEPVVEEHSPEDAQGLSSHPSDVDLKEVADDLSLADDAHTNAPVDQPKAELLSDGDMLSSQRAVESVLESGHEDTLRNDDTETRVKSLRELSSILAQRIARIQFSIVNHHLEAKDYYSALLNLSNMSKAYDRDPYILSCIGKCYISVGDGKAAESICKQIEALFTNPDSSVIVRMMKGFLSISQGQFMPAYDHFQAAFAINPSDPSIVNNLATCCLYVGQLARAAETLEAAIKRDPNRFLTEPIVFNLCTLYEMYADNPVESKRNLQSLVVSYAPDDFDQSVLRLA